MAAVADAGPHNTNAPSMSAKRDGRAIVMYRLLRVAMPRRPRRSCHEDHRDLATKTTEILPRRSGGFCHEDHEDHEGFACLRRTGRPEGRPLRMIYLSYLFDLRVLRDLRGQTFVVFVANVS